MIDPTAAILARRARLREAMARSGYDGLIVFFSGQHFMLRMNPLLYLTDFKPLGPSFLFLGGQGRPLLLTSPVWEKARAEEQAREVVVEVCDEEDLARQAAIAAKRLPGRVAIVGRETMPLGLGRDFEEGGDSLDRAPDFVARLAASRDPLEIERIERAAAIADRGFERLCETAEPGIREYELAAEIEFRMQSEGSDDNYGLLGAGAHNQAIRAPTDRRLEKGDIVIGEITPCYRGAFAQLCRTFVIGEPSALLREKYDLLLQAQDAGFGAARPGRKSGDIAKAVNAVIGAAGYGDYCRQPYMRTRGHGLGFGGVVPYDVTEDSGPELAVGMTMIIHPNQYIPETGYMMLGDTIAIGLSGPRRLTRTQRRLFWRAF